MADTNLLDRVRALLAKAEATEHAPEAEALTAKAAELMAKYGIERAQLGAIRPESDKPGDKKFAIANPWAKVKLNLLAGVGTALRCQCVQTQVPDGSLVVLHVFGYQSDIERVELLWTSLLVQQQRALAQFQVPSWCQGNSAKAERRSFMIGFNSAVTARLRAAEAEAARQSDEGVTAQAQPSGQSTALVLADRELVVKASVSSAYPRLRKTRVTYSGSGYGSGHAAGQKADIGGAKVGSGSGRALGR